MGGIISVNLPFQILCDYLEDKGINARLLRSQEPEGIIMIGSEDIYNFYFHSSTEEYDYMRWHTALLGDGVARPNIWGFGDGFGGGICADVYGDGYHVIKLRRDR